MIYPDGRACPVCQRKYNHLTGCQVAFLHSELDRLIEKVTIDKVMLVEPVDGTVVRGYNNREELEAVY